MRIAVVGGHGKIARLFGEQASSHHEVLGLIRDPDQRADLEAVGMEPVVIDLETTTVPEVARVIEGSDALLFAAGAGPGSGAHRKETVDYGAAVKSVEAAEISGVRRFMIISAMGTDDPPADDSVFSVYLRAKARADEVVMDSALDWTVVRPGRLTDDPGTGKVQLARRVTRGEIPREDVAAVLVAAQEDERTVRQILELVGGSTTIPEAFADLGTTKA